MRRRWLVAIALLGVPHARTPAQGIDAQCRFNTSAERLTQDACQKALDLFTFLAPQLGAGLAGGNAVAGEHNTLGGPGRISLGLRANVVSARVPRVERVALAATGAVASDYPVKARPVPVPTVDAAVGVTRGFPVGLTRTLGVDVLLNVAYLPSFTVDDVEVRAGSSGLKVGAGVRVGLLEETVYSPGVAVTYLRRSLPRVSLRATPGGDQLSVDDVQVETSAWRVVIGKRIGILALSAGTGQETYTTTASAAVRVTRAGQVAEAGPIVGIQELERDHVFASASLRLLLVSIVAEVGRSSGGSLATFNTFDGARADDPVEFASLGLRLRW